MAEWCWKERRRHQRDHKDDYSTWALSFNLRSHVAMETRLAFGHGSGDDFTHNETTKGRKKVDLRDEDSLLGVIK